MSASDAEFYERMDSMAEEAEPMSEVQLKAKIQDAFGLIEQLAGRVQELQEHLQRQQITKDDIERRNQTDGMFVTWLCNTEIEINERLTALELDTAKQKPESKKPKPRKAKKK